MLIYIENDAKNYIQTKKILNYFNDSDIIYINNYKNIFDKNYTNLNSKKSIIIAKLNSGSISETPLYYWHSKKWYFFKTSLNCVYDCSYCYLKWAFKNENIVIFVNYDEIKNEINWKIKSIDYSLENNEKIWFYSSDYSDILWMNKITWFCEEFIWFFEKYDNVMMEIRTKSSNIQPLIDLWFIPQNTEISFSLNPQILIEKYEKWTSSLDDRIKSINKLLDLWFKVWIRFLPLLPIKNYEKIYWDFIIYIKKQINIWMIYSIFASWLLYTKKDYNKILSKYPKLDILHMLELDNDWFYRESKFFRDNIYSMFKNFDNNCIFCLEY